MKVSVKYFGLVAAATKKAEEALELKDNTTVEATITRLVKTYGTSFEKAVYAESVVDGKMVKTPNVFLNKSRIQWVQDYPKGVRTPVKDGDMLWLGLIIGGG